MKTNPLSFTKAMVFIACLSSMMIFACSVKTSSSTPPPPQNPPIIVTVAGRGENGSLLLKSDGTLFAAGTRGSGNLFLNTNKISNYTFIPIASGIKALAADSSFYILKNNDTLWTEDAAISNGLFFIASNVIAFDPGYSTLLFIDTNHSLWGYGRNSDGQLGQDPANSYYHFPIKIADNVIACAIGETHSFYITTDGNVWASGQNDKGQLGTNTATVPATSSFIKVAENGASVYATGENSFLLKNNGSLYASGENYEGSLGIGTDSPVDQWTFVTNGVVMVACGIYHTLILLSNGTLLGTGGNYDGQLGVPLPQSTNRPIVVFSNVASVATGDYHSLVLDKNNNLWVAGYNEWGQLGTGDRNSRSNFVKITP